MGVEATPEYQVQVVPIETGYTLSVPGLRQFVVADGYEGSLDHLARALIAEELGQPIDSITVHLRYDLMDKYQRSPRFNWGIVLLGLATLSAAALGIALLNPVLNSIAGVGLLGLIVARLASGKTGTRRRIE